MEEQNLKRLQAELQQERTRLAEEIGSRFASSSSPRQPKANHPPSFVPRPATLGLGADLPSQASPLDRRLKGALMAGKRKREQHDAHEPGGASDEERKDVSARKPKQRANDPFAAARNKLAGARFRQINETLYTHKSYDALEMMQSEPEKMQEYHEGFREQVKGWPKVPVRQIFEMLQSAQRQAESGEQTGSINGEQLPNGTSNGGGKEKKKNKGGKGGNTNAGRKGRIGSGRYAKGALIIDLGAGEGILAKWLNQDASIRPRVLSFDLLDSEDGWVKGIDVAHAGALPLPGKAVIAGERRANDKDDAARIVDVAVFCLSLMATNWLDKIREASRVLRPHGEMIIAEVTSRFTNKADFVKSVEALGFQLQTDDDSNTHFILFTFFKLPSSQIQVPFSTPAQLHSFVDQGKALLKPCIYKRR